MSDIIDLAADGTATPAAADDGVINIAEGDDKLPRGAVLQTDGSVKLTLIYPVVLRTREPRTGEISEDKWTELHMFRLTGADMRAISAASNETRSVVALGKSARIRDALVRHVFDRMDGADANAASEVLAYFLDSGPKTGR